MITEKAVVIAYQVGIATVKCQSQSACGGCAAKSACGTPILNELTGETAEHIFTVSAITPLKVGQQVEIGLSERSLLFSALLLYVVPLLTILAATFLSEAFFSHELQSAAFILFCALLSFAAIRRYTKKLNNKTAFQPILLRVL